MFLQVQRLAKIVFLHLGVCPNCDKKYSGISNFYVLAILAAMLQYPTTGNFRSENATMYINKI